MRKTAIAILWLALVNSGLTQELEVFGYFEPQLMLARINNETYQLSSNKLRVDLQWKASENVAFGANFDYITYHGKTEWDILDYLPENIQDEVPSTSLFGYDFNPYVIAFSERSFLDNAYVKLMFDHADVTVGKQQLSFGTGYVWNPTDVFNQKDITDPTYEQPGHNAVRLDLANQRRFRDDGYLRAYRGLEQYRCVGAIERARVTFRCIHFRDSKRVEIHRCPAFRSDAVAISSSHRAAQDHRRRLRGRIARIGRLGRVCVQ